MVGENLGIEVMLAPYASHTGRCVVFADMLTHLESS